jgi:hypothetical protein
MFSAIDSIELPRRERNTLKIALSLRQRSSHEIWSNFPPEGGSLSSERRREGFMVLAAAIAGTLSLWAGDGDDDLFPAFEGRARIFLDEEDPWRKNVSNYVVPVGEIIASEVLLNLYDRTFIDREVYGVTLDSVGDNLHHSWVLDTDPFAINMVAHPYTGALYYGFARAAGHSAEVSLLYSLFGSVLWEYAGETGPASLNDLIMTGVGGSFLGEALFRMANLLLRNGGGEPGLLPQVGAGVLLPSATVNVYGNRAAREFEPGDPAVFLRMSLGASRIVQESNTGEERGNLGDTSGLAAVDVLYGLPGEPGYTYRRPFDYFSFHFTGSNTAEAGIGNVMIMGLLAGASYKSGADYRGIWGLYGNYDYISQETFRVATSALSLGTTGQCWLSKRVALQHTVTAGFGFGAAGNTAPVGERDYVYGAMPQSLITIRAIFGDAAMFDVTGREYFIRGTGVDRRHALANNAHIESSFCVRVAGPMAVGVWYGASEIDANYRTFTKSSVLRGFLGFTVSFLGDSRFGAVDWRDDGGP